MKRIRGEEQPGFLDILQAWLPHQPWFPQGSGRWTLTRTGGLRLPTPEGAEPEEPTSVPRRTCCGDAAPT